MTTLDRAVVAVTGADGFIGSHLTEALLRAGARVRALAQYTSTGATGWLDDLGDDLRAGLDIRLGDIRDRRCVDDLVDGADIVFHLAALIAIPYSYQAPQSYVDVNVTGTLNVLEAARERRVDRLVVTSTSEVYGTARFTPITEDHPLQGQSPYAATKIAADHLAESYARSFDLPVVLLRPFNTFGPRQSERAVIPTVIRQALDPACAQIGIGALAPVRDFNFVTDIADAFMRVGTADRLDYGRPYNAGCGRAVSVGEMVETVVGLTGCNKPVVAEDERRRPEKSEVFELLASADRLQAATGWTPATDFEAGIEHTIAWWRDRIAANGVRRGTGYQT